MADSPTRRSLEMLRANGWTVDVTERWIAAIKIRKDWMGFGDLLCCRPGQIMLVQTTTASNLMARWHKTVALPGAEAWLQSGGAIELHGWAKRGARGERKLWCCDVRKVSISDLRL